jgi:hypothetical protein
LKSLNVFPPLSICYSFCSFRPRTFTGSGVQPPKIIIQKCKKPGVFFICLFLIFHLPHSFAGFVPGGLPVQVPNLHKFKKPCFLIFSFASVFSGFGQGGLPVQVSNFQRCKKDVFFPAFVSRIFQSWKIKNENDKSNENESKR